MFQAFGMQALTNGNGALISEIHAYACIYNNNTKIRITLIPWIKNKLLAGRIWTEREVTRTRKLTEEQIKHDSKSRGKGGKEGEKQRTPRSNGSRSKQPGRTTKVIDLGSQQPPSGPRGRFSASAEYPLRDTPRKRDKNSGT